MARQDKPTPQNQLKLAESGLKIGLRYTRPDIDTILKTIISFVNLKKSDWALFARVLGKILSL